MKSINNCQILLSSNKNNFNVISFELQSVKQTKTTHVPGNNEVRANTMDDPSVVRLHAGFIVLFQQKYVITFFYFNQNYYSDSW